MRQETPITGNRAVDVDPALTGQPRPASPGGRLATMPGSLALEEPDLEDKDGEDVAKHDKRADGKQKVRNLDAGIDGGSIDGEDGVQDHGRQEDGDLRRRQPEDLRPRRHLHTPRPCCVIGPSLMEQISVYQCDFQHRNPQKSY